ncbi:MAG: glycosyltransferase family 39 protein [Victivallales bacterium]|nr:glycosyltransferase family 39 protein [Victivallales bacterium]
MRYEESQPNFYYIILTVLLFLFIFSPWFLNMRELIGTEGQYGSIAIDTGIFNPTNFVHGENLISCFPLFPWVSTLFYKMGLCIEYSLRWPSILALAGISVIVFETCRRVYSLQSAYVGSCFVFSNIFVLEKAIDGTPFTLTVLLLLSGWILWYYFGIIKGNWNLGWIWGMFFAGLTFYVFGWSALLYFFLPLPFMRRPLSFWKKIKFPGFTVGIFIIVSFILLWAIPQMITNIDSKLYSTSFLRNLPESYFLHLVYYPFNIFFGLLPWSILAWPVFCVAFYPLDPKPIFSRFLRTIFFVLFFVLWINPFSSTRDYMILAPPLAILTGANYWLLIRRHGHILKKILNYLTVFLIFLTFVSIILFLVPAKAWTSLFILEKIKLSYFERGIQFFDTNFLISIIQLTTALILGFILIFCQKNNIQIWMRTACLSLIFMLIFWSVTYPYRSQDNDARTAASKINRVMSRQPKNDIEHVIYKGPHIADIYILSCYLDEKIIKIYELNQLPKYEKTVYVFTLNTPLYPERSWEKLIKVSYKERYLYLWKGTLINNGK